MSLINQMLKDLEARREPELAQTNSALSGLTYAERLNIGSSRRFALYIFPLLIVSAVVIASQWYFGLGNQPSLTVREDTPLVTNTMPPVITKAPVLDQPISAPTIEQGTATELKSVSSIKQPIEAEIASKQIETPQLAREQESPTLGAEPKNTVSKNSPAKSSENVAIAARPMNMFERAENAYREGLALLRTGNLQKAEEQFQAALIESPDHHSSRETLSALYIRRGRLVEASSLLKEGLGLAPKHMPFVEQYARILSQNGENSQAIALLEANNSDATDIASFSALLAALYQRSSDFTNAANLYRKLTAVQPDSAKNWVGLGLALDSLKESGAAVEAYKRALRLGGLSQTSLKYIAQRVNQVAPGGS